MANRFEDLVIWQKARTLTAEIYRITSEGKWSKDFGLRDQIRRASVSIMANIAEGYERRRDTEFLRFLDIAKASAGEVRSHLYVALDTGYLESDHFDYLRDYSLKLIAMMVSFMSSVARNRNELHEERANYFPADIYTASESDFPESLDPCISESDIRI